MSAESWVRGASEPALLEHTIGEALQRAADLWPNAEALVSVHQNIRWTWKQFAEQVDSFAAGLLALGLIPGDRVGVCWRRSPGPGPRSWRDSRWS